MRARETLTSAVCPALTLLRECASMLMQAGIKEADKEAEIILGEVAGIDRVTLYRDNPVLTEGQIEDIREALRRRVLREPIQYILGYAGFYGMRIKVGPGVLIPRPETEFLVEEALKRLNTIQKASISDMKGLLTPLTLDLCTGSGAVALAIGRHAPCCKVYGVDISETALHYANDNRGSLGVKNVTFLYGHLFEPVKGMLFDMIVSNPPYIKSDVIDTLEPEVSDHEPHEALDGGPDGLSFFRELLKTAPNFLKPEGAVILEMAEGQKESVIAIAEAEGFKAVSVIRDYAGIDRVVVFGKAVR